MPARMILAALVLAVGVAGVTCGGLAGLARTARDGTVKDTGFPLTWSATENVNWKTELRGTGHSSPVVSKGKVFVAGCIEAEKKRVLYCVDRASGKIEWEKVAVVSELEEKHIENSWASSTPAADGERVFITFLDRRGCGSIATTMRATLSGRRSPGEFHSKHGFCSPPMLYKDLVIVNGDQDAPDGQAAFIVALDKQTGEERWRIDRPNKLRSYCPPVVIDAAGKKQLVLTGSKCVASYDPDTGKQLWLIDGPTEQFVSSMVLHNGVLLMTAGYPVHWVMAIDPSGSGQRDQDARPLVEAERGRLRPVAGGPQRQALPRRRQRHRELLGREDRQADWKDGSTRRATTPPPSLPMAASTTSRTTAPPSS